MPDDFGDHACTFTDDNALIGAARAARDLAKFVKEL